jgi:hypothetical protein
MIKRQLILNSYKTAEDGLWTLASLKITKASQVQTFVSVPGRFAPLDLSTTLTDGQPYYGSAGLDAVLESSEGTREERQERIDQMVNQLDGLEWRIVLPDHPDHYLVGRVSVAVNQSSPAYAAITVTATCQPWLYKARETVVELDAPITASTDAATFLIRNDGRKVVTPVLTVNGTAHLGFKEYRADFTTGAYTWSALQLAPGLNELTYTGSYNGTDTLTLTYREAVLL